MICADFLAGANLDHGDPETLLFSMTRFFKFLPGEAEAGIHRRLEREGLMSSIGPKLPRLRMDPEAYDVLRQRVLRRDGWRCQSCSATTNLEVHHQQFRSHSGPDPRKT